MIWRKHCSFTIGCCAAQKEYIVDHSKSYKWELPQYVEMIKLNVNRFLAGKIGNLMPERRRRQETDSYTYEENQPNFSKTYLESDQWGLYTYNLYAAILHLIQFFAVLVLIRLKTSKIDPDFVFVSPERELIWQNYALIKADTTETQCTDLAWSSTYQNKSAWLLNKDMVNHAIFDFTNTVLIPYKKGGMVVRIDVMIAFFFLLSAAFQFYNGTVLHKCPKFPRIINYIEYSVSSSLMLMVMAINVGIAELYTVISLAGLFFGMNIMGACTEVILELCIQLGRDESTVVRQNKWLWVLIPHTAAWVLFLFAIVPVLTQYRIIQECSNTGVPAHVHFAIALQAALFTVFGIVQTISMKYRLENISDTAKIQYAIDKMDMTNIALSFIAKTILAWTLLAPALSVNEDALRQ
jgi:hypothetical protein